MSVRRRLLITFAIAAVLLAVSIPRLRIEADVLNLMPQHMPELQSLKTLRERFQDEGKLLVALRLPEGAVAEAEQDGGNDPESPDLEFSPDAVDVLGEAAESLGVVFRTTEGVARSVEGDSMRDTLREGASSLGWMLTNAEPEKLEQLRARLQPESIERTLADVIDSMGSTFDIAQLQMAAYDPFGLAAVAGLDISDESGPFAGMANGGTLKIIELVPPPEAMTGYRSADKWISAVRSAADQWAQSRAAEGLPVPEVLITGEPAFMAETGTGIEGDFTNTSILTFVLIALLFLIVLRTLKPLINVMLMILLTVGITLAIGGICFGSITAMSMGFAAVVQGLVVDYGALIYRYAMLHPELSGAQIRARVRMGIIGASITTAVVFGMMALGNFPGLRQFGLLVACGTIVGAAIMLGVFTEIAPTLVAKPLAPVNLLPVPTLRLQSNRSGIVFSILLVVCIVLVFAVKGFPRFDPSMSSMRPRHSDALDAWEVIQNSMGKRTEVMFPVVVEDDSLSGIREAFGSLEEAMQSADADYYGKLRWWLPAALLPDEERQEKNKAVLAWLVEQRSSLEAAADKAGFEPQSLALFSDVSDWLEQQFLTGQATSGNGKFPGFVRRVLSHADGKWFGLGTIHITRPSENFFTEKDQAWMRSRTLTLGQMVSTTAPAASLSGWIPLGPAISQAAKNDALYESWPVAAALLVTLIIVLRRWRDVLIAVVSLLLAMCATLAVLRLFDRPLNMANIAAFPLIAGTGIDYSLHMLIALKEKREIGVVRHLIGKALIVCAVSSCIGFAALLTAGNRGVFDLGFACCTGLILSTFIALGLLPHWWRWMHPGAGPEQGDD
ncbi:MAG: MMPL family transporter [Verrucomicrobiales bacterium]